MKLLRILGDFCVSFVFFFGLVLEIWNLPEAGYDDETEDEPPPE